MEVGVGPRSFYQRVVSCSTTFGSLLVVQQVVDRSCVADRSFRLKSLIVTLYRLVVPAPGGPNSTGWAGQNGLRKFFTNI
jgi:hypothetical protein